ncbi:unnamed protein product [Callosobruchus maculatus]|uniref:Uncharacterized protein n=1 Tax=Callosobruchus maculatus TaxID=64391 RepID=A0A653DVF6_CALMS|nr:unnamed protein product [Callosobruchus maculatus]
MTTDHHYTGINRKSKPWYLGPESYLLCRLHLQKLSMILKLIFLCFTQYSIGSIHQNLRYFETLHADDLTHKIVKRGLKESSHPYNHIKEVQLRTHGRDFRLILSPKTDILHSNFKAYTVDGEGKETTVHVERDSFLHGRVFGEVDSHVSVHMDDGVMTGSIHLPEDVYHIEPSWRHLPDLDNKTMITYKQSDVKFSWERPSEDHDAPRPKICGYVKEGAELEIDDDDDEDYEKDKWTADQHHRAKRQIDQYEYTPTRTRCPLLLVADYRFFQEMGASNTKTTINYLISLIDRVHKIYNDTSWQDRQEVDGFKGMGFVIKKIVVHSDPTRIKSGEAHYNMIRDKWDVRNLLEVFSRDPQHRNFCLAHLFTHQTFTASNYLVLGLAYIAAARRNTQGGVCSKGETYDKLLWASTLFILFQKWLHTLLELRTEF